MARQWPAAGDRDAAIVAGAGVDDLVGVAEAVSDLIVRVGHHRLLQQEEIGVERVDTGGEELLAPVALGITGEDVVGVDA